MKKIKEKADKMKKLLLTTATLVALADFSDG